MATDGKAQRHPLLEPENERFLKIFCHGVVHGLSLIGEVCSICGKVKVSKRRWRVIN